MKLELLLIVLIVLVVVSDSYRFNNNRYTINKLYSEKENSNNVISDDLVPDLVDGVFKGEKDIKEFEKMIVTKEKVIIENRKKIETELEIASLVGSSFTGLFIGGISDGVFTNGDAPYLPIIGGALFAGAAYYAITQGKGTGISDIVTSTFGKLTLSTRDSSILIIQNTVSDIKESINNKVEETVDDIQAIPSNVQKSINKKIENTIDDIQNIPNAVSNAASDAADAAKKSAIKKADDIVTDIKNIPNAIAQSAQDAAEDFVDNLQKLPSKLVNTASKSVESVKSDVTKKVTSAIKVPELSLPEIPLPSISIPDFKKDEEVKEAIASKASPVKAAPIKPSPVAIKAAEVQKPAPVVAKAVEAKKPEPVAKPEIKKESFSPFWGSSAPKEVKPSPVVAKAAEVKKPESVAKPTVEVKKPLARSVVNPWAQKSTSTPAVVKQETKPTPAVPAKPAPEIKKESFTPFWGSSAPKEVKPSPVVAKAAEVKKPIPVVPAKPAPVPVKPTSTQVKPIVAQVKPIAAPPVVKEVPVASKILSPSTLKSLTSIGQSSKVNEVEALVGVYLSKGSSENLVKDLVKTLGSKDNAITVLPDIIGSLPRGELKSALNTYYSQI